MNSPASTQGIEGSMLLMLLSRGVHCPYLHLRCCVPQHVYELLAVERRQLAVLRQARALQGREVERRGGEAEGSAASSPYWARCRRCKQGTAERTAAAELRKGDGSDVDCTEHRDDWGGRDGCGRLVAPAGSRSAGKACASSRYRSPQAQPQRLSQHSTLCGPTTPTQ